MSVDELMRAALDKTSRAHAELQAILQAGQSAPVPAQRFTNALLNLREATAAVTELERRARGGEAPKVG